jgi:hypothetical protein
VKVSKGWLNIVGGGALLGITICSVVPAQASTPGSTLAAEVTPQTLVPSASPTPSSSPTPVATAASRANNRSRVANVASDSSSRGAFGIAGNMASLSSADLSARLDGIKATGVGWVRYDIEWSNIETSPGQYDWSSYDREVSAVAAHGLQSLAIIDYTPAWARRPDCSGSKMCAPADPNTYANFAAAAATRYTGYGVNNWEIWNEPNNLNFYLPAANPAAYTAMLRAAYGQIKQINPKAVVMTGGTAPADSSGGYLSPPDFIRGIYAAGGKGAFDAVAVHPYTWPYSPAWSNPDGAWGQMTAIHNLMANNGDGNKKLWITEYGAPTGGPGSIATSGFSTSEGHADHVTESLQARIVADSIIMESRVSWIGPFFWYSYKDAGTTSDTVENFFGLLRADGSQKPSYQTFVQMVASH